MAKTYAEQVTRTYEFHEFWWAMGSTYVEFTITFHYPDAPDEVQRVRIAQSADLPKGGQWWLYILNAPRIQTPINPEVVERLRPHLVDGALTDRWVRAFYGD